jgi:opacity protein-like surface antigen
MKNKLFFLFLLLIPLTSRAQFEQKVSVNFGAGVFKTFGKALGKYDPMQMPNFKTGLSLEGGIQFNLNRRLSLMADIGYMNSASWAYYWTDGVNDTHYTVYDTLENLLAEGYNDLSLSNLSIGLMPKLYILPGKKLNPYLFAGLNFNFTHSVYTNNTWKDADRLGILPPDDTGPYNPYLEKNVGIGFNPGFGLEYNPNDKICFYISAGYYFIKLKNENFKSPDLEENFNAYVIHAGLRYSFLKSKDL